MTRRIGFGLGLVLILSSAAGSAAEVPRREVDLSGRWLLTMPAGFEYEATLMTSGEGYRLRCPATNLSGVYQIRDRHLIATAPDNERMTGLVWEVKNRNVLILTVHPETAAVGSDYRDATLSRLRPSDAPPLRATRAPTVLGLGRIAVGAVAFGLLGVVSFAVVARWHRPEGWRKPAADPFDW